VGRSHPAGYASRRAIATTACLGVKQ